MSTQTETAIRIPRDKVEAMRHSFKTWPTFRKPGVSDDGVGFLHNTVYQHLRCGCRVTGNGTLQLPMTVEQCATCAASAALLAACKSALAHVEGTRIFVKHSAYETISGQLRAAIALAEEGAV